MVILAFMLVSGPLPVPTAPADCSYDARHILAMPYSGFDQDMAAGWRPLEERGCTEAVAEILRLYRHRHRPLSEFQRSLLSWHEGQVRALQGDYKKAVPLLLNGVPEDGGSIDFVDYALATVAFLQHDKPGLVAARNRLAAFPRPADFPGSMTITTGGKVSTVPLEWPVNLDVVDGLIRCYDKPYKVAYSCRS